MWQRGGRVQEGAAKAVDALNLRLTSLSPRPGASDHLGLGESCFTSLGEDFTSFSCEE